MNQKSFSLIQLVTITLLLGNLACSVKQADMDVEKVKEEINSRKIKRLTDAQIVQAAYDSGKAIVANIDLKAVECNKQLNINHALVEACSIVCDSTLLSNTKELQIWEAYTYNHKNGLPMNDNIQKSTDSNLLYTYPINNSDTTNQFTDTQPKVVFLKISKKKLVLKM